jgi:hypothetical protein
MPWHHRFRHYIGIEREAFKLTCLLNDFCFDTARDVLRVHCAALPVSVEDEASVATA